MPKKNTRVDTETLRSDVHEARLLILAAVAKIKPHLIRLTADERAALLKPHTGFAEKAPALLRAAEAHPRLAAAVDFDAEAVQEDLDNVEILNGLAESLREFAQDTADTILGWRDEMYGECLALHRVARAAARHEPSLKAVVDPLAPLFARPGRRTPEEG